MERDVTAGAHLMSRLSRWLDRLVSGLTLAVGWVVILVLIPLMLFHVLGRQVGDVRSEALSEIGADLFFVLVMLSFGYTYLRDGHVRVDVLRHRLGPVLFLWASVRAKS